LFPVFAGRLVVWSDGLSLDGAYALPLGEVGRLVDRVALHQVAIRTARWFIRSVASHLTAHPDPGGLDPSTAPRPG
jgi:hypothetical protein